MLRHKQLWSLAPLFGLLLIALALGLGSGGADAQDAPPPAATEEPGAGQPPVDATAVPTVDPGAAPPATTPEPTPASPLGDALPVIERLLNDIDLLATAQLGTERPVGWNPSRDTNDPQLPLLLRLNLELLTDRLLGAGMRPPGWFGAVASTGFAIARDIRHDLELLADTVIQPGVRPGGWVGDDPIMRCARATQNLVALLERGGVFSLPDGLNPTAPDYCQQVEIAASQFAEINLLDTGRAVTGSTGAVPNGGQTITVNSDFGRAFLDRNATLEVGIIPQGVPFVAVARSYTEFSNMMLVRGDMFEVYIDYTFTTISEADFQALPNVDTIENDPFCGTEWCLAG